MEYRKRVPFSGSFFPEGEFANDRGHVGHPAWPMSSDVAYLVPVDFLSHFGLDAPHDELIPRQALA
jgi:hypothetical protein